MNTAELPKALLHDHLDGGLRPETVIELAAEYGHRLPADDPDSLQAWFNQGDSGSLETYLAAFAHTTAVMQTPGALERVAREAVEDLAADGVRYAEIRFAPSLHTAGGLEPTEVVAAVAAGARAGEEATGCVARLLVVAMRTMDDAAAVAKLAVASRDLGVVGFDVAGAEAGNPAGRFSGACQIVIDANLAITIHAGEGDGPTSIAQALHQCGAQRLGHGVRIVEDATVVDGEIAEVGSLAEYVRDRRVPLEISVSSNLHTGLYPSVEDHPVGMLHRAGFLVTLNTDNRLMSGTRLSHEFDLAVAHHGFTVDDLHVVTRRALEAGFGEWPVRQRLLTDIDAAYRAHGSTV
ncbi:MAG: adenosine deaminase [Acidimicrobiia bacterium]|nr:adenosine deaminase [Acidimicrobiia bacterium]NNL70920.1 adenosine deaminase [Acidimicrobiia bacterium]